MDIVNTMGICVYGVLLHTSMDEKGNSFFERFFFSASGFEKMCFRFFFEEEKIRPHVATLQK